MKIIWRVSSYLFRYKGLFYLTIFLAVFSMLFDIAVPQVIRWIYNTILEPKELDKLWIGIVAILGSYACRDVLNFFRIRVNNILEQYVLIDLRRAVHSKLLELPVSFYDKRKSGEIASRVTEDVQELERGLLDGTEQGITALLRVLGIMFMLFSMDARLALVTLLPIPIVFIMMRFHFRATRQNWKAVREAAGEMNSLVVEDIQGNRMIQSFALQDREHKRFLDMSELFKARTLKAMFRWSIYSPTSDFISSMGTAGVVAVGGYLIIQDPNFAAGDLLAFLLYAGMFYEPLRRLHGLNHMLAAAASSGKRVFEILDHPVAIKDAEDTVPFPSRSDSKIVFENVGFSYSERGQVIESLNLELKAGETTALVGHTGAGKTTIANLLLRYYDVSAGAVKINDIDVRDIGVRDLRFNIGYVSQDPFLFDASVRDNLLLAKEGASEAEMIESLKGAHAWEFVHRMPEGLDTLIGEKGIRLSQGEKQRLTIARVLLKNPNIVILDEATASVDTETERKIQDALDELMKNRTVLVIAHRLSTVRKASHIVVLKQGKVIESGSHRELIEKGAQYANLWAYQNDRIPE